MGFEIIAQLNADNFLLFNKFGVNLKCIRLFGRVIAKYVFLTVKNILKWKFCGSKVGLNFYEQAINRSTYALTDFL
jgi:hypothetical protein